MVGSAELIESVVVGIALAMDAMAVTLSNTLCEPDMTRAKKLAMPLAFALFQAAMPVAGYFGGTLIAPIIEAYSGIVSLVILAIVGGKMALEALREMREPEACSPSKLTYGTIFLEAIATSIDAFVVGVAIVGGKMALEALREMREPEACSPSKLTYGTIFLEAIATSIDAFVVGVSLAASGANIVLYGASIGFTTLLCCLAVLALGRRLGERFGARAQLAGGIVLVCIGLKAFAA